MVAALDSASENTWLVNLDSPNERYLINGFISNQDDVSRNIKLDLKDDIVILDLFEYPDYALHHQVQVADFKKENVQFFDLFHMYSNEISIEKRFTTGAAAKGLTPQDARTLYLRRSVQGPGNSGGPVFLTSGQIVAMEICKKKSLGSSQFDEIWALLLKDHPLIDNLVTSSSIKSLSNHPNFISLDGFKGLNLEFSYQDQDCDPIKRGGKGGK